LAKPLKYAKIIPESVQYQRLYLSYQHICDTTGRIFPFIRRRVILYKKYYILLFLALAYFILCSGDVTADSISFNLITTATTNINAISLYLDNGAIHTAADLAEDIPTTLVQRFLFLAFW
jgi:hypothetical protein